MRLLWSLPLLLSLGAYAVFIERTTFSFQGRTYYALIDDAMISMRYGRNLADGHGLVWNAGQHVEGYTNFLWTLWMAVVHLLPFSDRTASLPLMLSSAGLLLVNLLLVRRLCALLAPERRLVAVIAMLATGLCYPLAYWSLRGMEVGLAATLITAAAVLALEIVQGGRWHLRWGLAAVLTAALLTRDDLLVPAVVISAFVVVGVAGAQRTRAALTLGGTILVVLAAHTIFRVAYYHDALPNTYYLKLSGIPLTERIKRGLEAIAYTSLTSLYAPLIFGALYVIRRARSIRSGVTLLAVIFVAQCAYSIYVGGDAWEEFRLANRYVAVVLPLLMVLAALGIDDLASSLRARSKDAGAVAFAFATAALLLAWSWLPTKLLQLEDGGPHLGRAALAAAGAVLVVLVMFALPRGAAFGAAALGLLLVVQVNATPTRAWLKDNAQGLYLDRGWAETGVVVREATPPGTTVAMAAAGNTAYFARRPGIDLLGKMDPAIAHENPQPVLFRPGHVKWDYRHSIGDLRPDVITQLFDPSPQDLCLIARIGYTQYAPQLYVRNGVQVRSTDLLAREITALNLLPRLPDATGCPQG